MNTALTASDLFQVLGDLRKAEGRTWDYKLDIMGGGRVFGAGIFFEALLVCRNYFSVARIFF